MCAHNPKDLPCVHSTKKTPKTKSFEDTKRGEKEIKKKKEDEIGLVHIFFSFFFYKQKHDALFKKKSTFSALEYP